MNRRQLGLAFIILGAALIFAALSLFAYNKYDDYKSSKVANETLADIGETIPYVDTLDRIAKKGYNTTPIKEDSDKEGQETMGSTTVENMETITVNGIEYIGIVNIPAMNITLPVTKGWSYPLMKRAACCYDGSAQMGNMIIVAHNLPSYFKGLQNLNTGDNIIFIDAAGNEYVYEILQTEILGAYDVEGCRAGSDEWDITLFSCTYGGRQRVTVRAVQINK